LEYDELVHRCRNCNKEFKGIAMPAGQGLTYIRANPFAVHLYCNKKLHIGIGDIIRIEKTER
jgi:hypothetical protein